MFHYFAAKEVLINELYLTVKRELVDASLEGIETCDNLYTKISKVYFNNVSWGLEHPEKINFIQQFINSPYLTADTNRQVDKFAAAYFQWMEDGKTQGLIKDIPFDVIYVLGTQLIFGVINYLLSQPERKDRNSYIQYSIDIFWSGIKK